MALMNAVPTPSQLAITGVMKTNFDSSDVASAETALLQNFRSFRISIALSVEVAGTDLHGQEFADIAYTEQVSCNGANIVINRQLGPDQQLLLKRNGSQAIARTVGQIGIRDTGVRDCGYLYAVALPEVVNQQFWNVMFPPEALTYAVGASVMRCETCRTKENVALDEIQRSVLEINHRLCRACDVCATATLWSELDQPIAAADIDGPEASGADRRKQFRVKMKTAACICLPGGQTDITQALDVSRGGVGFRSSHEYLEDTWVRVAVPYIPGSANIFVSGRIAWRRPGSDGMCEYGVQYSTK